MNMPSTRGRAYQSPQHFTDPPLDSDEDDAPSVGDEPFMGEAPSEGDEEDEGPLGTGTLPLLSSRETHS